jgi:hypothetical protein
MIKSQAMLTIWRRHTAECPHRDKGRNYLKCNCSIWADGYVNGKRTLATRSRPAIWPEPASELPHWNLQRVTFSSRWPMQLRRSLVTA